MLNKMEIGNRICSLRKGAGYTQTGFADMLGISTQAVSKWETGLALPDVEILLMISKHFGMSVNELLEGRDIFGRIANRPFEYKDMAYFVPECEPNDDYVQWAKRMVEEGWVKRNWEWSKSNPATHRAAAKKIVEHGGLILEIGAGPGGGYMPYVLFEDFDAEIIISDWSPTVMREWRKLFEEEKLYPPNIHYAALDNCDIPFQDNTIDVVSAGGGFGNTEGDKHKALTEIYRILKPGGLYIVGDGFVTKEMLHSLPKHAQEVLLEKRPDIFEDYYEASVSLGFKTIDNQVYKTGWSTKNDEGGMADLANSLGVEIIFSSYLRSCIK